MSNNNNNNNRKEQAKKEKITAITNKKNEKINSNKNTLHTKHCISKQTKLNPHEPTRWLPVGL